MEAAEVDHTAMTEIAVGKGHQEIGRAGKLESWNVGKLESWRAGELGN